MYTAGSNSFLGSKPRPLEVEGTLIVFSVLALNVRLHGSVLISHGFGTKFTITSFITSWREQ